ncbi:MAG: hypothetical protein IKT96_03000, partial [Paludibacteraceae bacterium]|nr:hypothetical protein [Paludibacteraceae bacterium]
QKSKINCSIHNSSFSISHSSFLASHSSLLIPHSSLLIPSISLSLNDEQLLDSIALRLNISADANLDSMLINLHDAKLAINSHEINLKALLNSPMTSSSTSNLLQTNGISKRSYLLFPKHTLMY